MVSYVLAKCSNVLYLAKLTDCCLQLQLLSKKAKGTIFHFQTNSNNI